MTARIHPIMRLAAAATVLVLTAGSAAADGPTSILQQILSRGTIRIAVLPSLPPYSRVLPSGEPEGYDIDIAKQLAEALKVKPEFVVTDIPGRVTSLQTHKVDITIADFTRNVERSTTIAFTDPYLVTTMRMLVPDGAKAHAITDLGDGAGIKVAISRGGTAERAVPAALPKAEITRFNTQADEMSALLSGQVDAMAEDDFYNTQAIKDRPGKLRQLDGSLARAEIAIGLPAGDFDLYRVLNLYVEQFNASGDNAKLFKKWFGFDQPAITARF
ncbi:MAG TPA: transporter substrate-binding domain-containing protein [Aliidongia sp.]|uniref:transporter substrate-binding domain-containing protein n=1 Tax=Aliidongia sp. TaxID=1914230 RepID=UPI002DDD8B0A|nr:transporter substrate-binding domain-containing protein [Aliidongia sp.]HEV2675388.1 transporter substrate-binding domain-containing protein [Aliidongia sp.]